MERQPIAPDDQQGEQGDDDGRADEAHLLADDGEDVVVLLLGQIGELLAAHAEAEAAQAAGGHGVEGLDDLIALVAGIGPRIFPHFDAASVVADDHQQKPDADGAQAAAHREPEQLDTGGEQNGGRGGKDQDGGGQVGLPDEQKGHNRQDQDERPQLVELRPVPEAADQLHRLAVPVFRGLFLILLPLAQPGGKEQHHADLGHLRRLELHTDLQPAGRPVVGDAHMGDQHSDQQQDGDAQDKNGNAAQALIVEF